MTDVPTSLEACQAPFLHPGDIVEKYRIDSLIGYGGMGEVYLATHTLLNRQCALKILPPDIAARNPSHSKRFLREAKLATQFKHPNVVEVWDVGIDPVTKVHYIAMEYVRGQTIAEWLTSGPLEEKNVLIIATKVAEVLEIAQSLNIVHRDIKPSNIMITFEGDVKVADLGIAKGDPDNAAGESEMTLKDSILGTPFYAS
ncbi:MAG TPA: serine/threonine-protein kinase, partial [Lentisphaeria bacterium]|nr:serine/threonine-protein kinase [Lentisphaeria bacterium]